MATAKEARKLKDLDYMRAPKHVARESRAFSDFYKEYEETQKKIARQKERIEKEKQVLADMEEELQSFTSGADFSNLSISSSSSSSEPTRDERRERERRLVEKILNS
jgi:hypothetical protein